MMLDWARNGADWPNRAASRFVHAAGLDWHVQVMGSGPVILLTHGTGAASHSWRDVMPDLARDFTVVAPDLPGHGFTSAPSPRRQSLPGMARGLSGLLEALGLRTLAAACGHSAGAAIVARMALDGMIAPPVLVSLNGALLPWFGLAGRVFLPVAQLLAASPLVPRVVAWRANDDAVLAKLISNTGSVIDARGRALYGLLARDPGHVAAALGMMANWEPAALAKDLPRLAPALTLIVGAGDLTVPPSQAQLVRRLVPNAKVIVMPGVGHLSHEERPAETAALIRAALTARDLTVGPIPGEMPRATNGG
jgi:magnesium chelatase accessory protein